MAHRVSRGIVPLILQLSPGWRWVVNFLLQLLYPPRKETPSDIHCKGGWMGPRACLDILKQRKIFCQKHASQWSDGTSAGLQHHNTWLATKTDHNNLLVCYRRELLEIGRADDMDFSKIVKTKKGDQHNESLRACTAAIDFMDDQDVPPLE